MTTSVSGNYTARLYSLYTNGGLRFSLPLSIVPAHAVLKSACFLTKSVNNEAHCNEWNKL